jgi:hypothetical protein
MRKIALLLQVVIAVFPVTVICEEFDWIKASAIAEVYADKAEECKRYFKFKIESDQPACQYLSDNYIGNENNKMRAAVKWSRTAFELLDENSNDMPYAESFVRHTRIFTDALTYISISQQ